MDVAEQAHKEAVVLGEDTLHDRKEMGIDDVGGGKKKDKQPKRNKTDHHIDDSEAQGVAALVEGENLVADAEGRKEENERPESANIGGREQGHPCAKGAAVEAKNLWHKKKTDGQ